MRGMEDTEAFQIRGQFVIPVESIQKVDGQWTVVFPEIDEGKSFDYRDRTLLAKMYKAAQECEAQIKLMGMISPDHYRNKVMNEADFQVYHGDVLQLGKATEAFGTEFTDRHDGDLVEEEAKANFAISFEKTRIKKPIVQKLGIRELQDN